MFKVADSDILLAIFFKIERKVEIMKNKKLAKIPMLLASTLVLTGCPKPVEDYRVTGDYMTGKLAKRDYNAYLGSAPSTLNPTLSQNGENVTHLANLVGTLVMNDNYGILRRELASSASHNANYTEFSFGIRTDVPWVRHDGSIYVSGGQEQYVCADDFVETAKQVLDYRNDSEIYYMYTLFINNAWEYRCYTEMIQKMAEGKEGYTNLKGKPDKQALKIKEMIIEQSGHEPDENITGDDIPRIANFSRVGVKAENNTVTYKLRTPAQFFPTMLTYTPYSPTNANFYKATGKSSYGTSKENMIYCGPFYLTEFSANTVKYAKNEKYFRKDEVHIDTVNYTVVDSSTSNKDMREAFDRGEVDGFSLSTRDDEGWKMYITGPDGSGTMQNPYSDLVNSRELDDITYTYHFVLNANRDLEDASTYNKATYWDVALKDMYTTDEAKRAVLENTNKAIKISEVRQLVLDGFDMAKYDDQFELEEPAQYQINTFTPRGYVYDEYGTDYVEYYYQEYADQKGLTGEGYDSPVAEAKALVGPQQYSGVNYTDDAAMTAKYPWLSLAGLREKAISAVQKYNEAYASDTIDFPIIIDHLGSGGLSEESAQSENDLIQSWNERANGCRLKSSRDTTFPTCESVTGQDKYPYFNMVNDALSEQSTYTKYANAGYYTVGSWGWVGDYADPLTYMHCYVTNGEMCKMSGNTAAIKNYQLNAAGTAITQPGNIFDEYNELVDDASEITNSNAARFDKFAEAEYMLINDLHYIKPMYMPSQGWAASVSRACGYENPTAPYGLADHSLIGIWVLVDVPTGQERKECRALQAERKEAALEACGRNTINPIYE